MRIFILYFLAFASLIIVVDLEPHITPQRKNVASDGYKFEQSSFRAAKAVSTIIRYENVYELNKQYSILHPEALPKGGFIIYGFTTVTHDGDISQCTIHIVDPEKYYMPEIIGHEFTHCISGNFHPSIVP